MCSTSCWRDARAVRASRIFRGAVILGAMTRLRGPLVAVFLCLALAACGGDDDDDDEVPDGPPGPSEASLTVANGSAPVGQAAALAVTYAAGETGAARVSALVFDVEADTG